MRRFWSSGSAQELVEYALVTAWVMIPLLFGIIFVAEVFWVWHSVGEFTREGARYAATHCWMADNTNVTNYMTTHVPRMIDMDQFYQGPATITVRYFMRDPDTGTLLDYSCAEGECSTGCVPDAVTVSVANYEYRRFFPALGLPAVTMPEFSASMAVGSAGCDETGSCLP